MNQCHEVIVFKTAKMASLENGLTIERLGSGASYLLIVQCNITDVIVITIMAWPLAVWCVLVIGPSAVVKLVAEIILDFHLHQKTHFTYLSLLLMSLFSLYYYLLPLWKYTGQNTWDWPQWGRCVFYCVKVFSDFGPWCMSVVSLDNAVPTLLAKPFRYNIRHIWKLHSKEFYIQLSCGPLEKKLVTFQFHCVKWIHLLKRLCGLP